MPVEPVPPTTPTELLGTHDTGHVFAPVDFVNHCSAVGTGAFLALARNASGAGL